MQPLTPVSETSEPPSLYPADGGPPPDNGDGEGLDDGADEDPEPPPALFDNIKQARSLSSVAIDLRAIPLHNIHVLFAKFSCDICSAQFEFTCVRTFVLDC